MLLQGLLLIDAAKPPFPGWLAIENQHIVDIGQGNPPEKPDLAPHDGAPAIICPGFIDAHLHLPQIDSIGCDGMELMQWLETIIFPAEMRWADESFAAQQIASACQRLLRAGTLGFAAFLTSHFHGYVHAVRHGYGLPLRAIVGQSLMDRNAPPELLNHPLTKIATSERARVTCSVNPRFAVSCTDELLAIARSKAKSIEGGAIVHTHLAENQRECDLVRQLFPNDANYTAVYDRHGLLTNRTLLAHCLHLSQTEWQLIAQCNSVVVHCPTANTFLKSGVFDLNAARSHNIRLALGSDVAAGPDIAMPRVARAMIETAKLRSMTIDPKAYIPSPADAWNLITRGNADALGWQNSGRLEIGALADLLILQPPLALDEHLIGRLIHTWRDGYITHRIVQGKLIPTPAA